MTDPLTSWARPIPVIGDTTSAAARAADPRALAMGETFRAGLYELFHARRDVRRFRPDPVPDELLWRVLAAAHTAPSVGHSQPWRFVVITDAATRDAAALMADRSRLRQAELLDVESNSAMRDLQVHGLREAPTGIVVCCDRRVDARGVLGRATFVDADLWSCVCAIENMWLAARAEGLGLGWVTLFEIDELRSLLGLPDGVECLGWLCLGWPDDRSPYPGLERAGWSRRAPLEEVVYFERWPEHSSDPPRSRVEPIDASDIVAARDASDGLLTSLQSLGVLDLALERAAALGIGAQSSGSLVLVGADHPVTRHGVSAFGAGVTRQVLEAAVAGQSLGAAAASSAGLGIVVVDAGVDGALVDGALDARPLGVLGDLVGHDALTLRDAERLVDRGRAIGTVELLDELVALGEVGMGNTTVGAALICALFDADPVKVVGRGVGADSAMLEHKCTVVMQALERARRVHGEALSTDPYLLLAALGGGEVAVLCGVVLGVAARGGLVVLDGLVTGVAAYLATLLEPAVASHLLAGQQSRELAHRRLLSEIGLEPLLSLRLRAGEGVGAVLASAMVRHGLSLRVHTARVRD